jgi:DNA repair exonuclease SbcCD nuclease subunit
MRFLHTSDWQLGLARYWFDADAQARFAGDRFEAVKRLGEVAREEGAELVVVAGDVFESNRVDGRTLRRGLDAMAAVGVPVFLLPGNHDALDAASVYRSRAFAAARPANVRVLDSTAPVAVRPGVEVVGAPWPSKRPTADLVAALAAGLEPAPGVLRIAVAHGAVDALSPDSAEPSRVALARAEAALAEGRFHYLALGDRHSATRVADRIWYAGSPEVTDFGEERPGRVLLVDLTADGCRVEERETGRWSFLPLAAELTSDADVAALAARLEAVADKPRTALRLELTGGLPLHARARLDELVAGCAERFATVQEWGAGPLLLPDAVDRDSLELGGFAEAAFAGLLAEARGEGPGAAVARDALALLYRLAAEGPG